MRRTLAAGVAMAIAAATLAFAATPPPEVKLGADGAFTDQAGRPLYTYAKDTPGQPATGVSENWSLARP